MKKLFKKNKDIMVIMLIANIVISSIVGVICYSIAKNKYNTKEPIKATLLDRKIGKCLAEHPKDMNACVFYGISMATYEDPGLRMMALGYEDRFKELSRGDIDNIIDQVAIWLIKTDMKNKIITNILNSGISSLQAMDILDDNYSKFDTN